MSLPDFAFIVRLGGLLAAAVAMLAAASALMAPAPAHAAGAVPVVSVPAR